MSLINWTDQRFFPNANSIFSNIFNDDFVTNRTTFSESIPPVNVVDNEDHFSLELAAPGKAKKDFKINIENNILSVSSELEEEHESENQNYTRKEYSYNSFSRSFSLPENVTEEKINATYQDGVLKITLPKKETTISKAKTIAVS